MQGIELLKVAITEGVDVLPKNFLSDNNIAAKFVGLSRKFDIYGYPEVCVYVIEEDGELKDKVVYQVN